MTREEEIRQKARELALDWSVGRGNEFYYILDKLVEIARWADEHPVNQWKDINKEQPPKDELPFLILYDDYGDFVGKETCFWSEGAYRLCSDGKSFKELEPWYHITHWIPIPELPEKED